MPLPRRGFLLAGGLAATAPLVGAGVASAAPAAPAGGSTDAAAGSAATGSAAGDSLPLNAFRLDQVALHDSRAALDAPPRTPAARGKFGGAALHQRGCHQYVELPALPTGRFTFAAWGKPTHASTWARVLDFGDDDTRYLYLAARNGNGVPRFAITATGPGGEQGVDAPTPLPAGEWSHLALSDGDGDGDGDADGAATLYVNGAAVGSTAVTTPLTGLAHHWLGRSHFAADPVFAGAFDEISVWSRVLTPDEVAAAATRPAGGDVAAHPCDEAGPALRDLRARTGKPEHLAPARMFDLDALIDACAENRDVLAGLHANQHIPIFTGLVRLREATGEQRYLDAARNFWDMVVPRRLYRIGGTSTGEFWRAPGVIAETLADDNAETCCAHNMLKLGRALFNQILGSKQDAPSADVPLMTYFIGLAPGSVRDFTPEQGATCCEGTGLESAAKYQDSVYFHDEKTLYVNLFAPTTAHWNETTITRGAHFPHERGTSPGIGGKGGRVTIKVRVPSWARGASASLNGRPLAVPAAGPTWWWRATGGAVTCCDCARRATWWPNRPRTGRRSRRSATGRCAWSPATRAPNSWNSRCTRTRPRPATSPARSARFPGNRCTSRSAGSSSRRSTRARPTRSTPTSAGWNRRSRSAASIQGRRTRAVSLTGSGKPRHSATGRRSCGTSTGSPRTTPSGRASATRRRAAECRNTMSERWTMDGDDSYGGRPLLSLTLVASRPIGRSA
ncbi:beta-L-arabinofuranosidase domain-containing protein [Actinosynnema mirum]|uniref:beta-L-arabinofuranosidase domain-containing protein n=1 Tax=Actinosynnema mirum TaxID=40567 RepID=UPI0003223801|nr:beta-L-arabinofuranosidase domain-containing protein [Actinosynnema mirum]